MSYDFFCKEPLNAHYCMKRALYKCGIIIIICIGNLQDRTKGYQLANILKQYRFILLCS